MDNNITGWFTTEDGVHVPIRGNQTKKQAMEEHFDKKESETLSNASGELTKETVAKLQKKYGFQQAKNFEEMKSVYSNMLHDPMISKQNVQTELDKWNGKTLNPYVSDDTPSALEARKQLIAIVEHELKSRR